jgi:hypothetical protein
MKDGNDKREGQSGSLKKNPRQNPRQDRLKLALRENLKRRKSQARGRDDFALAPSNADNVTPHHDGDEVPGE